MTMPDAARRNSGTQELHSGSCCARPTRRSLAKAAIAGGAVGGLLGGGVELAHIPDAHAQTNLSPEAALRELMDGNRRFSEGRLRSFSEDLKLLRSKTSAKQEPFAAVLACADSRVPVELIFDQSIGRLFVTRVAGNIATEEVIASLEYGVAVLGTKAIMVLGHTGCGAVQAAIGDKPAPGRISGLYRYIRPAIERAGPNLEPAIKANAMVQATQLRKSSPVIAGHIDEGRLKLVAAYYELASGRVTRLE